MVGEGARVLGFALAGATVLPAERPEEVRARIAELDPDVALVVLTARAAEAGAAAPPGVLTVVMPP